MASRRCASASGGRSRPSSSACIARGGPDADRRRWLRPGGHLLMTLTHGARDGVVEDDWLGAPMYFAGEAPETSLAWLRASGFELLREELVPQGEFGREVRFLWVLARRAGS